MKWLSRGIKGRTAAPNFVTCGSWSGPGATPACVITWIGIVRAADYTNCFRRERRNATAPFAVPTPTDADRRGVLQCAVEMHRSRRRYATLRSGMYHRYSGSRGRKEWHVQEDRSWNFFKNWNQIFFLNAEMELLQKLVIKWHLILWHLILWHFYLWHFNLYLEKIVIKLFI